MDDNYPLFIFEGIDGVGKTTASKELQKRYNRQKLFSKYYSFPGNIPGTLGDLVYKLHHNKKKYNIKSINKTSLQILHIAAHIDIIERKIETDMYAGNLIFLDRFWWSTYVYGIYSGIERKRVRDMIKLELYSWKKIRPAIIFLIYRKSQSFENSNARKLRLNNLSRIYIELAKKERKKYNVIEIENNSTIEKLITEVDFHVKDWIRKNYCKFKSLNH